MNHPKDYAAAGSHVPGEALRGIPAESPAKRRLSLLSDG